MAAPWTKRVCVWYDRAEWRAVYHELFSGDISSQKHAMKRLAVWKCRSQVKFPTAVELTWQLMSAYHQDLACQCQNTAGTCQHEPVSRMTYAMAIIRFINLLTEKNQKAMYALSVTNLALGMGLPDWLVDIRHDSTHSHMPSLPILRRACQFSLSYIKRVYWEKEFNDPFEDESCGHPLQPEEESKQGLAGILEHYMQLQFKAIESGKKCMNGILKPLLNKLAMMFTNHREELVDTLASEGYLIPTVEQMDFLGIQEQDAASCPLENLPPDMLVQMWQPVLLLLHKGKLVPELIHALVSHLHKHGVAQARLSVAWIYKLLAPGTSRSVRKAKSGNLRCRQSFCPDGRSLLKIALQNPCIVTAELLPCLFRIMEPALTGEQESKLEELVQVYVGSDCGLEVDQLENKTSCKNIKTVNDLWESIDCEPPDEIQSQEDVQGHIKRKLREGSKYNVEKSTSTRMWRLDQGLIDWSICPLGHCPGQDMGYSSLELPDWLDVWVLSAKPGRQTTSQKNNNIEKYPCRPHDHVLDQNEQQHRMDITEDMDTVSEVDSSLPENMQQTAAVNGPSESPCPEDSFKQLVENVTFF